MLLCFPVLVSAQFPDSWTHHFECAFFTCCRRPFAELPNQITKRTMNNNDRQATATLKSKRKHHSQKRPLSSAHKRRGDVPTTTENRKTSTTARHSAQLHVSSVQRRIAPVLSTRVPVQRVEEKSTRVCAMRRSVRGPAESTLCRSVSSVDPAGMQVFFAGVEWQTPSTLESLTYRTVPTLA